jgi:hypothetical protein
VWYERGMMLLQGAGQVFARPITVYWSLLPLLCPRLSGVPFNSVIWLYEPVGSLADFSWSRHLAPLAAEIAAGRQPPDTSGELNASQSCQLNLRAGRIVCADHYGNLITDLEADCLRRFAHPVIWFRNRSIPLQQSYGFAPAGELLGLVNSWGTLEIALAQGNAEQLLQAEPGEAVRVEESPLTSRQSAS